MLDDDSTSPRGGLRVNVRSSTKDSLAVEWRGADDQDDQSSDVISGYKVRYQAVGSTVVQYSHLLQVALNPERIPRNYSIMGTHNFARNWTSRA